MRGVLKVVAVHEDVLFATVSVQIQVQDDLSFLLELAYQSLDRCVLRVKSLIRIFPATVKVLPDQTTAIVSVNHAVRVQHRNDLENKVVPQHLGFRCLASQVVYYAFHAPATTCLAGVHASRDKDSFLVECLVAARVLILRCDRYHVTTITCQRAGQQRAIAVVLRIRPIFDLLQVLAQV